MTSFATHKTLMRTAGILKDMTIPEILKEIELITANGDTESGEVKAVLRDLRESAAILSRVVDRIRCEYDLEL
jgi:hypothetical protein